MAYIGPDRPLLSLRQTPAILAAILRGVSATQARTAHDGPGGWSVVGTVCHLRDYEAVYHERAALILAEDNPALPAPDQEALERDGDYDDQDLGAALAAFGERRARFLELLAGVEGERWARRGVHPRGGSLTLLELAVHVAFHDVNHIEQIVRTLAAADESAGEEG